MRLNKLTTLAGWALLVGTLASLTFPVVASAACPDGDEKKKPSLLCPDGDDKKKPSFDCPDGDDKKKPSFH
jgi:serine protease inhibitor ecotin